MKTIVSEKGQVTIPKPLRDRLGLLPGTTLDFEVSGGRLLGHKDLLMDPIQAWRGRGHLPGRLRTDEYLRKARGDYSG